MFKKAGMIMELNSNRDYLWEASSMLGTSGVGSITTVGHNIILLCTSRMLF